MLDNPMLNHPDRDLTNLQDRSNLNPNLHPPSTDLLNPNRGATELPVSIQLNIGTIDLDLLDKCKEPSSHGLIRHKIVVVVTTASLAT